MKITNINPARNFRGINIDYDTALDLDVMANALRPYQNEIDRLNEEHYGDVWCEVQEEEKDGKRGLSGYMMPYDDYYCNMGSPSIYMELPFQPYEGFDAKKFYEDLKNKVEKVYDHIFRNV